MRPTSASGVFSIGAGLSIVVIGKALSSDVEAGIVRR
jgi:hypothetical protein